MKPEPQQSDTVPVATLELREERAQVRLERVPVGAVVVRRELETRLETVTVELRTEHLVLRREHTDDTNAVVVIDGERLEPGAEMRVTIYREEARVQKVPVVVESVRILKRERLEMQSVPVQLQRETLRVDTEGEAQIRETKLER
jgi:uncharacterized protein (TIGR02271 family)